MQNLIGSESTEAIQNELSSELDRRLQSQGDPGAEEDTSESLRAAQKGNHRFQRHSSNISATLNPITRVAESAHRLGRRLRGRRRFTARFAAGITPRRLATPPSRRCIKKSLSSHWLDPKTPGSDRFRNNTPSETYLGGTGSQAHRRRRRSWFQTHAG